MLTEGIRTQDRLGSITILPSIIVFICIIQICEESYAANCRIFFVLKLLILTVFIFTVQKLLSNRFSKKFLLSSSINIFKNIFFFKLLYKKYLCEIGIKQRKEK